MLSSALLCSALLCWVTCHASPVLDHHSCNTCAVTSDTAAGLVGPLLLLSLLLLLLLFLVLVVLEMLPLPLPLLCLPLLLLLLLLLLL